MGGTRSANVWLCTHRQGAHTHLPVERIIRAALQPVLGKECKQSHYCDE